MGLLDVFGAMATSASNVLADQEREQMQIRADERRSALDEKREQAMLALRQRMANEAELERRKRDAADIAAVNADVESMRRERGAGKIDIGNNPSAYSTEQLAPTTITQDYRDKSAAAEKRGLMGMAERFEQQRYREEQSEKGSRQEMAGTEDRAFNKSQALLANKRADAADRRAERAATFQERTADRADEAGKRSAAAAALKDISEEVKSFTALAQNEMNETVKAGYLDTINSLNKERQNYQKRLGEMAGVQATKQDVRIKGVVIGQASTPEEAEKLRDSYMKKEGLKSSEKAAVSSAKGGTAIPMQFIHAANGDIELAKKLMDEDLLGRMEKAVPKSSLAQMATRYR